MKDSNFDWLLMDSRHKNGTKAHQGNLLVLLHPAMFDWSYNNAMKDQQVAVKEVIITP